MALAKELNISDVAVRRLKKEYFKNIKIDNRIKYDFDHTVFSKIDSHEKAYWLGFFAADGNVYKDRDSVQIRLQASDIDHPKKFCDFLKISHDKIKIYDHGKDKNFKGAHLHLDSKQLKADLIKLGVEPNKSLTYNFPSEESVPSEFINSYLLGYIDGDGSISIFDRGPGRTPGIRIRLIGTYSFLKEVLKRLSLNPDESKIKKEHNCESTYVITLYKKESLSFLEEAYKNLKDIPLERKRNIYNEYSS